MAESPDQKQPHLPEKDAVKRLRERFEERKSEICPSTEMDEVVKKKPARKDEPLRKIAKPGRDPDLDLP
jgi:hypothetical protein